MKWAVFACTCALAAVLQTGCSSRQPNRAASQAASERDSGNQGMVAAQSVPSTGRPSAPGRDECRPAGAIGAANPTAPGSFLASFDVAPDDPLGVCGASDWDIAIHSRAPNTWYALDSMEAQHGMNCAGPPATHQLHGEHAAAVFLCRDHLMTALNADDYGVIYLVPNQLVDLRQGPVVIRFDLSTERMSTRDWVDLWLTPWDDNLALPLEESDPDLQGPPRNSIQVTTTAGENSPVLKTTRDGRRTEYKPGYAVAPLGSRVAAGTNQAATRQAFELTVTRTSVRFERLASATAPALVFWEEAVDFPFDSAVLQLGHHSYNPTKDGAGVPATWHWDNIGISHSIPFQMIRARERYVDEENGAVSFEQPAPRDAWLRFSAIGRPEVSFDGGRTWTSARRQDAVGQLLEKHHPEHFSSYWMPIPEGATTVTVRFKPDDWYSGPYFAQDFAIWAR